MKDENAERIAHAAIIIAGGLAANPGYDTALIPQAAVEIARALIAELGKDDK